MRRFIALVISHFLAVATIVSPGVVRAQTATNLVVTYHPQATRAGEEMLAAGGNAFDAFVAATLAEYVVAEGGTSLAGPLGALTYDARKREVAYLDADFNEVKDPAGKWSSQDDTATRSGLDRTGKAVLVPGALAGLEEMSCRYGNLGFDRVVQPALSLARDGFPVSEFYATILQWSSRVLERSEYGRQTFFRNGHPLRTGDTLKQPELAKFLSQIAEHGSAYMYRGQWAKDCVRVVRSKGGLMTEEDLVRYRPSWEEPWKIRYRGYDLYCHLLGGSKPSPLGEGFSVALR